MHVIERLFAGRLTLCADGIEIDGRDQVARLMRAMEIEQKQSHAFMTATLLFIVILLSLQFGILYSEMLGSSPKWTLEVTNPLRNMVDALYASFN